MSLRLKACNVEDSLISCSTMFHCLSVNGNESVASTT